MADDDSSIVRRGDLCLHLGQVISKEDKILENMATILLSRQKVLQDIEQTLPSRQTEFTAMDEASAYNADMEDNSQDDSSTSSF